MLKTVVYFCGKRDKFIRIFLMNRKFIRTAFFFSTQHVSLALHLNLFKLVYAVDMKGATKMIRKHRWLLLSDTNTHRGCFCFVVVVVLVLSCASGFGR